MSTIIRVKYDNSLPSRDDRDAALRSRFGAQVSIIEWDAPEDPLELFAALRTTVFDNRAVAVEIDSDDRTLTAALGLAAAMAVVPSNRIPILLPCYSDGNSGVSPIYDVVDSGKVICMCLTMPSLRDSRRSTAPSRWLVRSHPCSSNTRL